MPKFILSRKKRTLTIVLSLIAGFLGLVLLINLSVKQSNELVLGAADSKDTPTPTTLSVDLNGSDMYEKVSPTSTLSPSPAEISTIQKLSSSPTPTPVVIIQPQKVETFPNTKNGFAVKAADTKDMDGITFSIVRGDDTISDKYILKVDQQDMNRDGNLLPSFTSQLYLFSEGVKQVNFFYDSSSTKNFTITTLDFDNKPKVQALKALSSSSSSNAEFITNFMKAAGLNIITRDKYGATEGNRFELLPKPWTPGYQAVNRIVIHHTGTEVDMANPANTVNSIWRFHNYNNDWGDIGYNYLIDPYGNIYEGRAGTNGVTGAHAPPNEGSIGIALLGDYSVQAPTQASIDSLAKLVSYLSIVDNIPLNYKTSFDTNNPAGIYPHSAISDTTCPGNAVRAILPGIVTSANNIKSNFQTAIDVNTKVTNLLSSKEYVQWTNSADVLIETSGMSDGVKTKLLNPSTRLASAFEMNGVIVYNIKKDMMKQFLTEVALVDPSANPQPNYIYQSAGWTENIEYSPDKSFPDDYYATQHWNLEKIKAPEAWSALYNGPAGQSQGIPAHGGTDNVIVAVLDTGVAYENYQFEVGNAIDYYQINDPDLGRLQMPYFIDTTTDNTFETGIERIYGQSPELQSTTFLIGYDASMDYVCTLRSNDETHPCSAKELEKIGHANDDDGHGTYVTSIIAASTGIVLDGGPRTYNIVGIASNVKILPIKVFFPNDQSFGLYQGISTSLVIKLGIEKAVEQGTDVINMSFGGACDPNYPCTDPIMEAAIDDAYDNHNIVLVAASGNTGSTVWYPAVLPKVIAVGSSTINDTRATYSSFGSELDIMAPVGGGGSSSTLINSSTYACGTARNCDNERFLTAFTNRMTGEYWAGTSFAAPQVAAAAALIKSNKSSLTNTEIKDRLIYYATDIETTGRDDQTGYGNLNIYESLTNDIFPIIDSIAPQIGRVFGGTKISLYGHSFQEGIKVYIGDSLITSLVTHTPTKIEFLSPANSAGTKSIRVVNPNHNEDIWDNAFTYVDFSPSTWFLSGPGNWAVNQTKATLSGDFNRDGKSDIALIYDYGGNNMAIWVMPSDGTKISKPDIWYMSGPGNWSFGNTKSYISGDFNDDGFCDIAFVYDYGNNNMAIWVMPSDGTKISNPGIWFMSGPGNWAVNQTKATLSGDFNRDGKSDIALIYDYGGNNMAIWVMPSDGTKISKPDIWYMSGPGNWSFSNTKSFSSGDYDNNGFVDISAVYDYGNSNMAIWVFK